MQALKKLSGIAILAEGSQWHTESGIRAPATKKQRWPALATIREYSSA
jgi:hypothetical protein